MRNSMLCGAGVLLGVVLSAGTMSQAATVTINPGLYGTYNSNNVSINVGTYSVRTQGSGSYNIFNDQRGVQMPDLADGTYEIGARDANVTIGTITLSGGSISASSGQITTGANTVGFINHEVILNHAAGWTDPCASLWNLSGSGQRFVKKFVMPAGAWGGVVRQLGAQQPLQYRSRHQRDGFHRE